MGFTTYTCEDCGYSYVDDYTNSTGHHYDEVVTPPTCTEIGFSTFTCKDCGKSYIGNEQAKLDHDYETAVTSPTCTSMGFTVFTCKDCGDIYTGDYTDVIPHNYKEVVTAPTCSEIGFSTFTCEDCGKSYQGNETAKIPHNYDKAVTEPTCTSMGFTTYTCPDCGDTYTADYTDMKGHDYETVVTTATCTSIGYTTYICKSCGNTYIADETAKAAHNYEITVKHPDGKVLDKDNRIKVTVTNQDNEPIEGIKVTVNENKGNTDNDTTNKLGYIIVPVIENDNTDGNGGVVEENKDNVKTQYTVIVENNDGKISGADVTIADSKISVKLPDTHTLTTSNQTKVTVLDKNAQPVKGVSVTVTDKNNKTATKTTDTNGQILVPVKTSGRWRWFIIRRWRQLYQHQYHKC